jgi:hypothetical protein
VSQYVEKMYPNDRGDELYFFRDKNGVHVEVTEKRNNVTSVFKIPEEEWLAMRAALASAPPATICSACGWQNDQEALDCEAAYERATGRRLEPGDKEFLTFRSGWIAGHTRAAQPKAPSPTSDEFTSICQQVAYANASGAVPAPDEYREHTTALLDRIRELEQAPSPTRAKRPREAGHRTLDEARESAGELYALMFPADGESFTQEIGLLEDVIDYLAMQAPSSRPDEVESPDAEGRG